jgi:hypothetical protein
MVYNSNYSLPTTAHCGVKGYTCQYDEFVNDLGRSYPFKLKYCSFWVK